MILRLSLAIALMLGAAPAARAAHREHIVFLGDSLTQGLGVPAEASYPMVLRDELRREGFRDISVTNAGVNGATTADGLSSLEDILALRPTILVVELGANDAFQRVPISAAQTNLAKIIAGAQRHGVRVLLEGIRAPAILSFGYYGRFAEIYKDLADEYHVSLVPSLLAGVSLRQELNQEDGLHPNVRGHQKLAATVLPFLRALLLPIAPTGSEARTAGKAVGDGRTVLLRTPAAAPADSVAGSRSLVHPAIWASESSRAAPVGGG